MMNFCKEENLTAGHFRCKKQCLECEKHNERKTMKTYKITDIPKPHQDDISYSVDVIVSLDGELNIAYYNFNKNKWEFNTQNMLQIDQTKEFIWMYAPKELKQEI